MIVPALIKPIVRCGLLTALLLPGIPGAQGLPVPPSGKEWTVVEDLTDEFDAWDASKWWKPLWNYGEPVQMLAANSGVTGGKLWIKATLDSGAARWFETSRVMSYAQIKFPMYTECSMRTAHISAYNTFWLNNGNSSNRDEIDICENNSKPSITSQTERPYTMYSQYFIVKNGVTERNDGNFDNRNLSATNALKGVKWNEAYHTLGAWWKDKNHVQFYLDGEPAGSVTTISDFTLDQNIIWDLWTIDATWSGGIANQADLLDDTINTMYVDWIHTYRLVDAPVTQAPPWIASTQIAGGNIVMGVTNGTPMGWFNLLSSTNMELPSANWATNQMDLQFDGSGFRSVTNPITQPQEFYRVMLSSAPASPGIEFTAPDYSDGTLDGQQNWIAEAGWSVGDSAGSGYASTTVNSEIAVWNEPITLTNGQSYSISLNLQFGGSYSTPSDWVYAFLCGLKDSNAATAVGTGATAADANIQIFSGVDSYRLLNNYSTISGASTITTGQLNPGDILQFDYTLTRGADAASTSYTVRLQNLTDGTDTGTGTVSGVDASIYNALAGSGAYAFFQSIVPGNGGSGLSGVQVNSVLVETSTP